MKSPIYYDKHLKEIHFPRSKSGWLQLSASAYGKVYLCIKVPFLAEIMFSVESELYDRKVSEQFLNRAFD